MLRKFLASVFVFAFVVFNVYFVSLLVTMRTVASEDYYTDEFYEVLVESLYMEIFQPASIDGPFAGIDASDLRVIFEDIVVPRDVQMLVGDFRSQLETVDYSDGGWEYSFDLVFLLDRVGVLTSNVSNYYYDRLPKCDDLEVDYTVFSIDDLASLECVPDSLAKDDFDSAIAFYLDREFWSDVSNSFEIIVPAPEFVSSGTLADSLKRAYNYLVVAGVILSLIFLGFIALLIGKPVEKIFVWQLQAIFWTFLALSLIFFMFYLTPLDLQYEDFFRVVALPVAENVLKISVPAAILSLVAWIVLRRRLTQLDDPS